MGAFRVCGGLGTPPERAAALALAPRLSEIFPSLLSVNTAASHQRCLEMNNKAREEAAEGGHTLALNLDLFFFSFTLNLDKRFPAQLAQAAWRSSQPWFFCGVCFASWLHHSAVRPITLDLFFFGLIVLLALSARGAGKLGYLNMLN